MAEEQITLLKNQAEEIELLKKQVNEKDEENEMLIKQMMKFYKEKIDEKKSDAEDASIWQDLYAEDNSEVDVEIKPWDNVNKPDWYILSRDLSLEWIEKYPNKPWDWRVLSRNHNLTLEWIEKYPDKPWDWNCFGLSDNPSITLEWLEKYPDKPWYWGRYGLSKNPNLTVEWFEKYPDKHWSWDCLSENPSITLEWNEKYPNKSWNAYCSFRKSQF
jgi:hypothetical protein